MDTIFPSLSPNPKPVVGRDIFYYIATFALLAAILGGTLWYADRNKQQVGPVFDSARQFVPEGTASLDVSKALAAFNFPKPLPFFEEKNVVQSVMLGARVSSSTISFAPQPQPVGTVVASSTPPRIPSPFLSYRIFGQTKETIRNAFIEYFKKTGWEMEKAIDDRSLVFLSDRRRQIISILFLDALLISDAEQSAIIVTLSRRNILSSR